MEFTKQVLSLKIRGTDKCYDSSVAYCVHCDVCPGATRVRDTLIGSMCALRTELMGVVQRAVDIQVNVECIYIYILYR